MSLRFAKDIARFGEAPSLIIDGSPVATYAELARRATAFGDRLGERKGLVAIEGAASEHAIIAYLGARSGGHAVALLPPDDPAAFASFEDRFAPDAIYRRIDGRWRLEVADTEPQEIHPDLALLLMTSGSTGQGKGVRLSSKAIEANAEAIASYLGLGADDRAALVLPLHYSYGLSVLNSHLAVGAAIYLSGRSVLEDSFLEAIKEHRCTNLAGVPFTYELLERIDFRANIPSSLRFMTVAGGRLAPDLVRAYHASLAAEDKQFFVMYGQTEATARIAYLPPHLAGSASDRIGQAIPGGELVLHDQEGRTITGPDTPGELVYRGPNVMMGYASGRGDLIRGPEVDELYTGDIACRDADGLFRIVGRKRRMSKIAGIRIGHDALEEALASHGIAAAVVGNDEKVLAAYTSQQAPEEVRACLAEAGRLMLNCVEVVHLQSLPRLATGKLDYEALYLFLEGNHSDEEGVAEAFRNAFFPQKVSDNDSFVSLCGDSLRHVEITMVLERRLGQAPIGWERMSAAELARLEPAERGKPSIGTDLLIRALAILLVVVVHETQWPVPGGAAAMMVLIGFNIARFRKETLYKGDFPRFFRSLGLVLVPYYLILCGYALAWGNLPWASVFLVGNFGLADPGRHSMLPFLYWFVEAYAQTLVVLAGLFLAPAVRDFARTDAFRFGLLLLLGAVAFRFAGPMLWPIGGRQIFTLPWVFYLFSFGWCAALAESRRQRLLVLALAGIVMPLVAYDGGNWIGSWVKYGLQFVIVAVLLLMPRIVLPGWLSAAVLPVAAAGYHIYLVHRFVPEILLAGFETSMPGWVFTAAAVIGGVALGLTTFAIQRKVLLAWKWANASGFLPGDLFGRTRSSTASV
ncbi:AMP-binding protein [Nitratireductor luteus]|uniref:AMP-binding protein n=1 Tax=Nitratireductor luteus TaxID=2976980 RepID=UPI00223F5A9F|nr:AMP-binding protein [Nitratireductor luteus]